MARRPSGITIAFALAVAASTASVAAMYRGTLHATDASARVARSLEVLRLLEVASAQVVGAEAGQRGFILTGDETFLAPYYDSMDLVDHELTRLQELAIDSDVQRRRIEALRPTVAARLEQLRKVIDLRRTQGLDAARAAVAGGPGPQLTLQLRKAISEIETEERSILAQRSARAERSSSVALWTLAAVVPLNLGLLSAFYVLVHRDIARRQRSGKDMADANEQLRHGVEELEARGRELVQLSEMAGLLQACADVEEAMHVVERFTPRLLSGLSGGVYLLAPSGHTLEAAAQWGEGVGEAALFAREDCWALRRGRPHVVEDASRDIACPHAGAGATPCLCLPLSGHGGILGVLYIRNGGTSGPARQLARSTADTLALALANLRLRETLRTQSIRDPLTSLFNRRYFDETLDRESARARRSGRPVAVLMLDVDQFKAYNDTFGHPAGDQVLRELGIVLADMSREGDLACRYGGEEFALVFADSSLAAAAERAEELRQAVERMPPTRRGRSGVTVSIGVAGAPEHGHDPGALVRAADGALYGAKAAGRNRVVVAKGAPAA